MWAVFAQVSGLVGLGLIGPLVIMLAFTVAALIHSILAAVPASRGETFRYPLTLRLVT